MSISPSKGTALTSYTRFILDSSTPSLWRVTFNHPPINLIDSVMIGELSELFAAVERNARAGRTGVRQRRPGLLPGALRHRPRQPFPRRLTPERPDRLPPLDRHRGSAGQAHPR